MKARSVLIVEGHADTRCVIRILLERRGVLAILEASSSAEGLEILKSHDVALVICEQDLPDQSGMDLLKRIECMDLHPWFFLTSYDTAFNISNVHYEKFRFIRKPTFGLLVAEACKILEDLK